MQNKAQVTLFIIVGLLVILVTGITIYFFTEAFKYPGLDNKFIPVATYAEQCIEDIALEGIFLAGLQGGSIYPTDSGEEAYLDAGFPVPYWFLAGQDRSVTIPSVEADLAAYIEANLNNCLNNFAAFDDQFTITALEEQIVSASVEIEAEEVNLAVNIPVQVSDAVSTATLPTIKVDVKNTIGNKIFLAYNIMETENNEGFLEFYTNEIIAASAWLPYEGFDFTCNPRRWTVDEMQDYIQQAVAVNLPFIMFDGTSYEKTGDLYYDNIYVVDIGASGVKDLKVTTAYRPAWGMDLDITPSKNGKVTDIKMVGKTIAIPCIKVYHHKYTTTFPVLFEITDEDNSKYPFFFATPVIMKRNEPDRYATMTSWPEETDAVRSAVFCSNTTDTTRYTLQDDGSITTEKAEEATWLYSLDIIAMDSLYGYDDILQDVAIRYQCGQFTCDIGTTAYGSGGLIFGYPLLSSSFPSCLNGEIIAEKQGYMTTKITQTVSEETDDATIQMELHRLHPLDIEVTAVINHNNIIEERELEPEELVVMTIKNDDIDFENVIVYPINAEEAAGFDTLELVVADDITYAVDIRLIQDDIYTGGFVYNWTPSANAITAATQAHFYVIKKDIYLATDENYIEAMQYAEEESKNYPPELLS